MTMAPTIPQTTPRSLEVLIEHVRRSAMCPRCHVLPGASCSGQGRRGVHLARFNQAYSREAITAEELSRLVVGLLVRNARTFYRYGMSLIVRDDTGLLSPGPLCTASGAWPAGLEHRYDLSGSDLLCWLGRGHGGPHCDLIEDVAWTGSGGQAAITLVGVR